MKGFLVFSGQFDFTIARVVSLVYYRLKVKNKKIGYQLKEQFCRSR